MSLDEKNALSSVMLEAAYATTMLMDRWILEVNNGTLSGKSKMLYSGMKKGVQQARFYFSQFYEQTGTAMYQVNKNMDLFDKTQQTAACLARIILTTLNLRNNGYPIENIEDSLNRILANEENPELLISKSLIDKFKVR